MAVDSTARLSEADVVALSTRKNEPSWVRELRLKGWKAFQESPVPKLERTTLNEGMFHGFQLPGEGSLVQSWEELPDSVRAGLGQLEARENVVVLADGSARLAALDEALRQQNVIFAPLAQAVVKHPELVEPYLAQRAVPADDEKPWALNAAVWQDGVFLYVPEGVQVDVPLEVLSWSGAGPDVGVFERFLVVAAPNSRVTLLTSVSSDEEKAPRVYGQVMEVYAGEGAQVKVCALQTLGTKSQHFALRRAVLEKDADLQWIIGEFGSSLTVSISDAYLEGSGSQARNLTVFFSGGEQHLDLEPRMLHTGTKTFSDILVKGVAKEQGRSVYAPLTHIDDGAFHAEAFQRGTTLLLDPNARAYCIPQLHVLEENVDGAGHAATVGQVDADQLFYLRSRGLTESQAKKLMVAGFFHPMLEQVPIPEVREQLESLIDRKMA